MKFRAFVIKKNRIIAAVFCAAAAGILCAAQARLPYCGNDALNGGMLERGMVNDETFNIGEKIKAFFWNIRSGGDSRKCNGCKRWRSGGGQHRNKRGCRQRGGGNTGG